MIDDLATRDAAWTEEDAELLELLMEQAARELASRHVMATIWADLVAGRDPSSGEEHSRNL